MQFRWISTRLLTRFPISALQSRSITMASETKTYPGSKAFSRIEISKWSLTSSRAAVTSGVPQGTVLRPLLFLVYINDLPSRVSSSVRLFADDCLLYRVIRDQQDAASLQTDLNHLQEWEREWQILFNPDKCEHIRITNKRKVIQTSYNIHGQILNETSKAKYLGVTIDNTLSWNSHIDTVTKKAN